MKAFILALCLIFPTALLAQSSLPAGTVLPVRLDATLSAKTIKPGQTLNARVMQDVHLADDTTIRAGSRVTGHVIDVSRGDHATETKFSFQFDTLDFSKKTVPIHTNLRALASLLEVDSAQIPETGPDRGTPPSAWITNQIGGETVYRGGGHVMYARQVVGEPVAEGILAPAMANPASGCRSAANENHRPQSLWVFSSHACGIYGYPQLKIVHAGRTEPAGVITLTSRKEDWKIWSGSGMLLRII